MSLLGQCYYRIGETRLGHRMVRGMVQTARSFGFLNEFRMPLDSLAMSHDAVGELMRMWQRMHWSSGDGMMPQPELLAMYQLACDCDAEGDYVELGAWKGLTTCYLAAACRIRGRGRVYAVDTFEGTRENNTRYASIEKSGGSTLDEFNRRVCKAGYEDLVCAEVGYTTQVVQRHRQAARRAGHEWAARNTHSACGR